jgi:adenylate kinase family enzyme
VRVGACAPIPNAGSGMPAPDRRHTVPMDMNRIRVVGTSGSGKSTTAAAIARKLDIPYLELDSVHWLPGWQERDAEEFRRIIVDFAKQPRWVVDGNYSGRPGDRLDDLVDTYVWLDLPRWRVTLAVLRRTIRRGRTGEELWSGNREHLLSLLKRDPLENVVLWSWTQHRRQREGYEEKTRTSSHRWIRLHSRREVNQFLDTPGEERRNRLR